MKQTCITVHNYRDVSLVPKYLFYFTSRTKYSPTLFHFLGSKSPWLHSLYRGSVIFILVGHMTHKGIPLNNYECSKSLLYRGCTPIQVLSYASYPVSYYFAAFFFACLQELFCNRPCNMPDFNHSLQKHRDWNGYQQYSHTII